MTASAPSAASVLYRMFRPAVFAVALGAAGNALGLPFWCSIAAVFLFAWLTLDGIDDARSMHEAAFLVALAAGTAVYALQDEFGVFLIVLWFATLIAAALVVMRRLIRAPAVTSAGALGAALAVAAVVALSARLLIYLHDGVVFALTVAFPAAACAARYRLGRLPPAPPETVP